jgi:hypothetical protein
LAVICALDQESTFSDPSGNVIQTLNISPVKRKLTDKRKRNFSIVGHHTARPILIARAGQLQVEIYFNHHFFVEPKVSGLQYFPSASVILRSRNFLRSGLARSPGSWGADIRSLTYDWDGTFVLEAAESDLSGQVRRNFRGYKLVTTQDKLFLSRRRPTLNFQRLLSNNGFTNVIVGDDLDTCWPAISREGARYIREQRRRLDEEGGTGWWRFVGSARNAY